MAVDGHGIVAPGSGEGDAFRRSVIPVGRILIVADGVGCGVLYVRARGDALTAIGILGRVYVVGEIGAGFNLIYLELWLSSDKTFNGCSFLILSHGIPVC